MTTVGVGFIGLDGSPASARTANSPLKTQVPCTVQAVPAVCTLQVNHISVVNGAMEASGFVTSTTPRVKVPFTDVPVADPGACPL
jgi:hypothetical protein